MHIQRQADAAVAFCTEKEKTGIGFFGCPVRYSASGLLPWPVYHLPRRLNGVIENTTSIGTSKCSAIRNAKCSEGLNSPRSR